MKELNDISFKIIGCAYNVHSKLGPGLLESAYEACLVYELLKAECRVERQKPIHVIYQRVKLDTGYRTDLVVENRVIVELKSVESVILIHEAQLLTYLKLAKMKLGLLINFNVTSLKRGIMRRLM